MRILICGSTYYPHLNGQAIFTSYLTEEMAKRGHTVVVLAPGASRQAQATNDVTVVPIPAVKLERIHGDLYAPWRYRKIVRAQIEHFRPDIVHVQDPYPVCQALIERARRCHIPVVATHHSGPEIGAPYVNVHHPVAKKIFQWGAWRFLLAHLSRADLVTAPSRASVEMLVQHGLRVPTIRVPCGVRLAEFAPDARVDGATIRQRYGLDPDKVTLLYVGRLDYEKRVPLILQAMALLDRDDVQVALAGEGAQANQLRQLADELALGQRVHFLGRAPHEDLPALISGADVFVMPCAVESFSIATVEAMVCARPVLAANAGALPELVRHGASGYLFRSEDASDLARGIEYLIEQRAHWAQMGKVNARRARRYDFAQVITEYEQAYQLAMRNAAARYAPEAKPPQRRIPPRLLPGKAGAKLRRFIFLVLFLLTLSGAIVSSYDTSQAKPELRLADLQQVDLSEVQRLLVIAPHPDDESLGAAGMMRAVVEQGGQVRVVVITNGDAQIAGPFVGEKSILPKSQNYVKFGQQRQRETLSALAILGVPEEAVDFLGYPDGQLRSLWEHWADKKTVTGRYTAAASSPYDKTYNKQATYWGDDLFQDLLEILNDYQPDLVLVPHPEDTHTDHRAVSNFSRFALAYYQFQTSRSPHILGYLAHYLSYPVPRGNNTQKSLLPPIALSHNGVTWVTYLLDDFQRPLKYAALKQYVTQQAMIGEYMRSFARANEIFCELPLIDLAWVGITEQATTVNPLQFPWDLRQPARERVRQLIFADADLVAWKAMRANDLICFAAETRGDLRKEIGYRILVKLPNGATLREHNTLDWALLPKNLFGTCFDREAWGNPPVVGFSAETWWGRARVDSTAWHFIIMDHQ